MGLVGLVSFLNGIETRINGISGISLIFEREWFRDDVPPFGVFSRGVRRVHVRTRERRIHRKNASTALGFVLHGHTYLSRVHTTMQCMTMFKGTVDGNKFAKGIHAVRHATIPVKSPLSPSHSMLA